MPDRPQRHAEARCTIEVDRDGCILAVDDAAADLLGIEARRLEGVELEQVLTTPREGWTQAVAEAVGSRRPTWLSARLHTAAGPLTCLVRAVPLGPDDGAGILRLQVTPRDPPGT